MPGEHKAGFVSDDIKNTADLVSWCSRGTATQGIFAGFQMKKGTKGEATAYRWKSRSKMDAQKVRDMIARFDGDGHAVPYTLRGWIATAPLTP